MRVFAPVFLLLLICSSAALVSAFQVAKSNPTDGGASALKPISAESELYSLVNEERKRRNLPLFALDDHLVSAAHKHSGKMAAAGKLSHQFPDELELKGRLARAGARFDAVAENVAESDSVQNAHTELMHSPGHRANLLNPGYNSIGISIVENGESLFVTEDFSHRVADQTVENIENQIFQAVNQLRSRNGLAALKRAHSTNLREVACKPGITASAARGYLTGAGFLVVFSQADVNTLPGELKKAVVTPTVGNIEIGVCYPPESKQGFAMFTAVVVTYK